MSRRPARAFSVVLLSLLLATPAAAQYPGKPIRIVVTFPPGGTADAMARFLAQPLSQTLAQPVVIDNRPGADGAIAAELVAKALPDGYTLLQGGNTAMLGSSILRKTQAFDPIADFTPVSMIGRYAFFLVTHASLPVKTLTELIDYVRANPGKLNYGSGNVPSILMAAQLMSIANLDMVHIPYKGDAPAMLDLAAGRTQLMFASGTAIPLVKDGRLRALATVLSSRHPPLPDVPTIAEAGMSNISIVVWAGLFGPAKMPKEIVGRLTRDVNAALKRQDLHEQFEKQALEPGGSTPEELGQYVKDQLADWKKAAAEAGIKPE